MSLGMLGLGYAGIGVLVTIAIAAARGMPSALDAMLTVTMWPLWGPLALARDVRGTNDPREQALLGALARAQASPLASVLPDAESARVLASRLREASMRLGELDAVLARPDFDPVTASHRAKDLAARGATAAAATAELRVVTLGHLRTLRERYRAELDEVHELIAQLVTQAELLRLQPDATHGSSELVRELVARVEGLSDLFTYQATLGAAPEYPVPWKRSTSA
jgi:hypothetical protein